MKAARQTGRGRAGGGRGFSLIESLVASAILGVVVLAVAAAMSSAQTMAFEGQKRLLAAMAADDLMVELATLSYDDVRVRGAVDEPIGAMATLDGEAYGTAFWAIGRRTTVVPEAIDDGFGGMIPGVLVEVETYDEHAALATVQLFVAEPTP